MGFPILVPFPGAQFSYRVGTGTSVRAPSMTACCSRTKAMKGLSRKSTSPTSTLEASASRGNFFMNLFFSCISEKGRKGTLSLVRQANRNVHKIHPVFTHISSLVRIYLWWFIKHDNTYLPHRVYWDTNTRKISPRRTMLMLVPGAKMMLRRLCLLELGTCLSLCTCLFKFPGEDYAQHRLLWAHFLACGFSLHLNLLEVVQTHCSHYRWRPAHEESLGRNTRNAGLETTTVSITVTCFPPSMPEPSALLQAAALRAQSREWLKRHGGTCAIIRDLLSRRKTILNPSVEWCWMSIIPLASQRSEGREILGKRWSEKREKREGFREDAEPGRVGWHREPLSDGHGGDSG